MIKKIKTVIHVIWAFFAVTSGITIGAMYGWEHHGLVAAIALGFVGFWAGLFVAVSPEILFMFFR